MKRAALTWLACAVLAACEKKPPGGGPTDANPPADLGPPDVPTTPRTVDFTVSGCPSFDGSVPRCSGPAPLTVSFAPIVSGPVSTFFWDFGDEEMSAEPLPTHTYPLPDRYDVSLLADGVSSTPRRAFIEVTANPLGGACDVAPQCEASLLCLCGQAGQCPAAFWRGLCTSSCASTACPTGAVCADLGRGAPGAGMDWRAPHCLRACAKKEDCAPGQSCRALPVTGPPARWESACFFDFPLGPGAPCRGPTGATQDDLCLGGRCADFGARGLCAPDCSAGSCPTGTSCATFADGRKMCLVRCEPNGVTCGDDPLLGCVAPGGPGPLMFTVDPAGAPDAGMPATYCAPKRCAADGACGPSGICQGAPTGHCTPRP